MKQTFNGPLDLREHTFGDTKACITLYRILKKDGTRNDFSKVDSIICKYTYILNQLEAIVDKSTREYMIQLIYEKYKEHVKNKFKDKSFTTYLLNVIQYYKNKALGILR